MSVCVDVVVRDAAVSCVMWGGTDAIANDVVAVGTGERPSHRRFHGSGAHLPSDSGLTVGQYATAVSKQLELEVRAARIFCVSWLQNHAQARALAHSFPCAMHPSCCTCSVFTVHSTPMSTLALARLPRQRRVCASSPAPPAQASVKSRLGVQGTPKAIATGGMPHAYSAYDPLAYVCVCVLAPARAAAMPRGCPCYCVCVCCE